MNAAEAEKITKAKNLSIPFTDYTKFEGDQQARGDQQELFVDGDIWAPQYSYDKLDRLYDASDSAGEDLVEKKHKIQEAVFDLESAHEQGQISDEEYELYAGFHETRLKRIMLVEAARRMLYSDSSAAQITARQEFMSLNEELYGEFDSKAYVGMLNTEKERLQDYTPSSEKGKKIKSDLEKFFSGKNISTPEIPILNEELIEQLGGYIADRYKIVLDVVPDIDDSVVYDADRCMNIVNEALKANGLAEIGWKCVIDSKKTNPSTSTAKRLISLPSSTRRTAAELRRLIIHEAEVHARRGENGNESGLAMLVRGTADYADVEEGLGVILESALAGTTDNPSFYRARDRYLTAGLALGVGDYPRDARQTYEILWRMIAVRLDDGGKNIETAISDAKKLAMGHVENAFRGTNFAMPGIIYTKLKVYYEGLKKNAEYFKARTSDLETAFDDALIGKYDHTNPSEAKIIKTILAAS